MSCLSPDQFVLYKAGLGQAAREEQLLASNSSGACGDGSSLQLSVEDQHASLVYWTWKEGKLLVG